MSCSKKFTLEEVMDMICSKQEHTMAEHLDMLCGKRQHTLAKPALTEALDNVMECYPEIPVEEMSVEMDQEVLTQTIMRIPIRSLTEKELELIHTTTSIRNLYHLTSTIHHESRLKSHAILGYLQGNDVPEHLRKWYITNSRAIYAKYENALDTINTIQRQRFPLHKDSYH